MEPAAPELLFKRLRWQCRRGMKEMDALLLAWLEQRFGIAGEQRQQCFIQLLQTEDDVLWRWLAGRARPDDDATAVLIDEIVATTAH